MVEPPDETKPCGSLCFRVHMNLYSHRLLQKSMDRVNDCLKCRLPRECTHLYPNTSRVITKNPAQVRRYAKRILYFASPIRLTVWFVQLPKQSSVRLNQSCQHKQDPQVEPVLSTQTRLTAETSPVSTNKTHSQTHLPVA